jgi:transcriptional regulator with GAF, ATPase, and Fis domain
VSDTGDVLSFDELVIREREIVLSALKRTNWKIYGEQGAAALLKVKPTTLVSKMNRLNIRRESV